jgi:hypothetical protein
MTIVEGDLANANSAQTVLYYIKRKNNSKKSSLHVKIILHVFSLSYLPFYLTRLSQQPF